MNVTSSRAKTSHKANNGLAYALLALIVFLASFPGVFHIPALDRDESRFAQASKQMLESGDYIRIRYQDDGRNKKPAGIHWLQAAATAVTTGPEAAQIWTYRLPSLIGAMAAAMLTFWAGLAILPRRAAFIGAALFGSTLLLTSEAHVAKTDAVLCAFTVLSTGALARLYVAPPGPHRGLALLFWAATGLGFLIKGPITPLVSGLAMLLLFAFERRAAWMKPLLWWAGPALFVALVLPWFVWVQVATDGAFLEGAVGKDLRDKVVSASEGHGGPPGYHLAFLLTHFFPATLLLIPGIVLAFRALRTSGRTAPDTSGLRFIVAWVIPTWLLFEFLPTKLSHYILPAYPALGLLCGWAAQRLIEGARAPLSRAVSALMFALAAAVLALIASPWGTARLMQEPAGDFSMLSAADITAQWMANSQHPLILLWAAIAAAMITLILAAMRRLNAMIVAAVLSSVLIGHHLREDFLPSQQWIQPTVTARLALAEVCARPRGNPETCAGQAVPERVRAVGYAEPSFVFTTGTNTTIPPQTVIAVQDGNRIEPVTAFLINVEDEVGAAAMETLTAEANALGRCTSASSLHPALNYSNGNPVMFIALRIEDCP